MENDQLETEIAASFGLTLCDFCHEPREIHTGFDHGKRMCLLAGDSLGMLIRFPNPLERGDTIRRVNGYYETLGKRQEAINNCGSGI